MKRIKKFFNIFKKNQRYGWALLLFVFILLIRHYSPVKIITSKNCANEKCGSVLERPSISKNEKIYYLGDFFPFEPKKFYRLTFRERSTADTEIAISVANSFEKKTEINNIILKESLQENFHEIIFSTDIQYGDLLFEKKDLRSMAEIKLSDIRITKLNISNGNEIKSLKPAIGYSFNPAISDIEKNYQKKSIKKFTQLKEPNVSFGQIFQAKSNNISAVAFDINVTKTDNRGNKNFILELRRVVNYSDVFEIQKGTVASFEFEMNDIEKYRQSDGIVRFPIHGQLLKGEYYFIGINNKNIEINNLNFLTLGGSPDNSYANGVAALKNGAYTYEASGDLYFEIFGANFNQYQGKKILYGMVLEDLGKNTGLYTYKGFGNPEEISDLSAVSPDIIFNKERSMISGNSRMPESYMEYEFNTIYNSDSFIINARQSDLGIDQVRLTYSFDKLKWIELPSKEINGLQNFDSRIKFIRPVNKIFLRIQPVETENGAYGINSLTFQANVTIK